MVQQQLVELGGQRVGLGQVAGAYGAARDLVLVGRADTPPGGADAACTARRLARTIERCVQRQDQRRIIGDAQRFGSDRQALGGDALDFGQQRDRVHDHTVADNTELAAHQSARQQREFVDLLADNERVPGIVAALEAHDRIRAAGEPVDDLAFAFIAPLGADYGNIGHCVFVLVMN